MQKRIIWVDWAKALLIGLVCVGHFSPPEIQMKLICNMHMPAFFIISGFLYRRHNAWKTLLSFVIPVLFFSLICFILYIAESYLQHGTYDVSSNFYYRFIEEYFVRNLNNPYESQRVHLFLGLWFIIALIGCRFLAGDLKMFQFTLKYKYFTFLFFLVYIIIDSYFPSNPMRCIKLYYAVFAFPFFIFGYILRSLRFDISSLKFYWVALMVIFYCLISNYCSFGMMTYSYSPTYLLFFINAIMGSMVLFWFCANIGSENSIVEIFSLGTLLILPLHKHIQFFVLPIFHYFGITPGISQHILPWIVTITVFILCYYPIVFLNNYFPILLGKLHK